jgi:Ferritin-like
MDARFFTPGTFRPLSEVGPVAFDAAVPGSEPLPDPPLEPHDEAVLLLTAAAEIEHALMVQYLFAAYSVQANGAQGTGIQNTLLQIAREEMGHLATVQNLLHVVGGPLHLQRDPSPSTNGVYPFRFVLEPVSLDSIAKYVVAESPLEASALTPADRTLLATTITEAATRSNAGEQVQHVGPIFERLEFLFTHVLTDDDVRLDSAGLHATYADWGFRPRPSVGATLIVDEIVGADGAAVRAAAAAAVHEIGQQGEGFANGPRSHFERFFALYKTLAALPAGTVVTRQVATDPNTTPNPTAPVPAGMDALVEAQRGPGRITHPQARAWAQLFNLRYRLLLGQLEHFLRQDGPRYTDDGDRTARGLLLIGTFDEMRHLSKIAGKLVQLPLTDPAGALRAGPPFELPYSLDLPDGEPQRWRMHLDASRAAVTLVRAQLPTADPFLTDLVASDTAAQVVMAALAAGEGVPEGSLPVGFAKAVTILEEAVRGFSIKASHRNQWADTDRAGFLDLQFPTGPPIALNADQTVDTNPDDSALINVLEGQGGLQMPFFRPPVPPQRIAYLRSWITDGAPDNDPHVAVGVHHEQDPAGPP